MSPKISKFMRAQMWDVLIKLGTYFNRKGNRKHVGLEKQYAVV